MKSAVKNPLPRLGVAVVLLVWTGANLFTNLFRFQELLTGNVANRWASLSFAFVVIVLPLAISVWLLFTIMPRDSKEPKRRT